MGLYPQEVGEEAAPSLLPIFFFCAQISKSYENKRMQAQLCYSGGSFVAFAGDVVY